MQVYFDSNPEIRIFAIFKKNGRDPKQLKDGKNQIGPQRPQEAGDV